MNVFKKTFLTLLGAVLVGGAFASTSLTNPINSNELTKVKAAEEVTTFTFNSKDVVNSIPITTNDVTVDYEFASNKSNKPAYNSSENAARWYWGTKLILTTTETSNKVISNVNFTLASGTIESKVTFDDTTNLVIDGNTITSEVGVNKISFEVNGTKGSLPIRSIEVTTKDLAPEIEITDITLSGDMTKKEYHENESWDATGLVVKGNDNTIDIDSSDVTFAFTPSTPSIGVTSVEVVANYNGLTSDAFKIEGITVTEAPNTISDVITADMLNTSSSYATFSYVKATSDAVYAGKNARNSSGAIQLRSSGSDCGIVSTVSGGYIRQVIVEWNSSTNNSDKQLDIYLSNNPYIDASDLYSNYDDAKFTLDFNETTLDVVGDYKYVGIRSNKNTLYLDSVTFVWEPTEAKEIASVSLSGTLGKTEYYTNESWDTTGLVSTVTYTDDTSENIVVGHEFIFDPATPVLGTEQVNISFTYEGFPSNVLTFDVNVIEYLEPVYVFEPTGNPDGNPFTDNGVTWEYYLNQGASLYNEFDNKDKGLHFGTGKNPATSLNFFSDAFIKDGKSLINRIDVNASTASDYSNGVTLNVRVNDQVVGTTTITSTPKDYSFTLATPAWGHVEIEMLDNGEAKPAAIYLKSIAIYAVEHEVSAKLIPAINALEDIHTCDVVENDEKFDTFLTAYKDLVDEYRTTLEDVIVYDYGFGDTSYSGNRLLRTDFITKYDACSERYAGAYNAAPIIANYDNSTLIATIVVVSIVSLSALCVFFIYERKRRLSK